MGWPWLQGCCGRAGWPPIPKAIGWAMLMLFLLVSWVLFRAPSLGAAWRVLASMIGSGAPAAPTAPGELRTIGIAAAFAFFGPTSQEIAARLRLYPWLAPVAALATLVLLFKLGDGPPYEFIYFHF